MRTRGKFGCDTDRLSRLQKDITRYLAKTLPEECKIQPGKVILSQHAELVLSDSLTILTSLELHKNSTRLPERKEEQAALATILTTGLMHSAQPIRIIIPVCPDYGSGTEFYHSLGVGISPQAEAGIQATKTLSNVLDQYNLNYHTTIAIADTEDDKSEIIERVVNDNASLYHERCLQSAELISEQLLANSAVDVTTFSQIFPSFREKQYLFEEHIKNVSLNNQQFADRIHATSIDRASRHASILGREEQHNELTIRYMAQYAALGHIARDSDEPVIFVNYPTPNRKYYNIGTYEGIYFREKDKQVIPVIGSVIS